MPQYVADVVHIVESVFLYSQRIDIPDLSVLMGGAAAPKAIPDSGSITEANRPLSSDAQSAAPTPMDALRQPSRIFGTGEVSRSGLGGESTYIEIPSETSALMAGACLNLATRSALLSCDPDVLAARLSGGEAAPLGVRSGAERSQPGQWPPSSGPPVPQVHKSDAPEQAVPPRVHQKPNTLLSPHLSVTASPQPPGQLGVEAAPPQPSEQSGKLLATPAAGPVAESGEHLLVPLPPLAPISAVSTPTGVNGTFPPASPEEAAVSPTAASNALGPTGAISMKAGGLWSWFPAAVRRELRSESADLLSAEQLAQGFNPLHHIDLIEYPAAADTDGSKQNQPALPAAWVAALQALASKASKAEARAALRLRHELRDEVPGLPYSEADKSERSIVRDLAKHFL